MALWSDVLVCLASATGWSNVPRMPTNLDRGQVSDTIPCHHPNWNGATWDKVLLKKQQPQFQLSNYLLQNFRTKHQIIWIKIEHDTMKISWCKQIYTLIIIRSPYRFSKVRWIFKWLNSARFQLLAHLSLLLNGRWGFQAGCFHNCCPTERVQGLRSFYCEKTLNLNRPRLINAATIEWHLINAGRLLYGKKSMRHILSCEMGRSYLTLA